MTQPIQADSRTTPSQVTPPGECTNVQRIAGPAAPSSERSDEAKLLDRIRQGDREAFAEVYSAHRESVHRFILGRVSSRSEAEDLTQETFAQAISSIDRFEGRSSLRAWLLGIARNVCLRFHRFAQHWMITAGGSSSDRDPAFDSRIEIRVDAVRALDRCDLALAAQRGHENHSIFHRRYAEGKPVRSIADQVEKTSDAVRASLRRSRIAIQRAVPQHEDLNA